MAAARAGWRHELESRRKRGSAQPLGLHLEQAKDRVRRLGSRTALAAARLQKAQEQHHEAEEDLADAEKEVEEIQEEIRERTAMARAASSFAAGGTGGALHEADGYYPGEAGEGDEEMSSWEALDEGGDVFLRGKREAAEGLAVARAMRRR